MSIATGPKIVTNGLSFGYDMYNTGRSWMGKPTTNLISISNWNNSLSGWAGWFWISGTTTMDPVNVLYPGVSVLNGQVTSNGTGGPAYLDLSGLSTTLGTTYTISVWFKSSNRTCYTYGHDTTGAGTVTGNSTVANGTWQKSSFVFTVVSTTGAVRIHLVVNSATAGDMIYVTAPQAELGSVASSFINGTRSTTQAILDSTNNNIITANSLVYASDNTFTFAGGINYCSVSNLDSLIGDVTLESVVNLATANGPHQTAICTDLNYRYGIKLLASYHGNMAAWAGFGSTDYLISGGSIQNTGNAVISLTRTSSTGIINLYLNGSLVATGTGTTGNMSSAGSGQGRIGIEYHSGSYGFNGSIFTAKAYNTALTATEVFNNFSALRGRYGL